MWVSELEYVCLFVDIKEVSWSQRQKKSKFWHVVKNGYHKLSIKGF